MLGQACRPAMLACTLLAPIESITRFEPVSLALWTRITDLVENSQKRLEKFGEICKKFGEFGKFWENLQKVGEILGNL